MQRVSKPVGVREDGSTKVLGTIVFPVFESVDEASELYGGDVVLSMLNKSISGELERVAREALKKEDATDDAVQALVDAYRLGIRAVRPSLKNFTKLAGEFSTAGNFEALQAAYDLYNEEDVEAAFNYLKELKDAGKMASAKKAK
jgi:hypothetical protein